MRLLSVKVRETSGSVASRLAVSSGFSRDGVNPSPPVPGGFRIVLQFAIGYDRRRVRILQIDRIEVELQMEQQRCTGQNEEKRASDHRNAMPLKEIVQGRAASEAKTRGLAWRLEQGQGRRYQSDAAGEWDQHAANGDQAQLRQATIAGR